jgi:hypothetical protein
VPEQYTAWQRYADKVMAFADDASRARIAAAGEGRNALQKIDQQLDQARNRLTALEDIALAAKSLYGMLNAEQKLTADRRLAAVLVPNAAFGGGVPPSGSNPFPAEGGGGARGGGGGRYGTGAP